MPVMNPTELEETVTLEDRTRTLAETRWSLPSTSRGRSSHWTAFGGFTPLKKKAEFYLPQVGVSGMVLLELSACSPA